MKIKKLNTYDYLLEYTFNNLNEILQTTHQIVIEENEKIINMLVVDLLNYLKESTEQFTNNINDDRINLHQINNQNISKLSYIVNHNNKKDSIINELNNLYESINCNVKEYYFDNDYNDTYLNKIVENYISNFNNILTVNKELYKNEISCINKLIDASFDTIYENKIQGLLESNDGKISNLLNNIKNSFGNKHDKIVARDKQWLSSNKKNLLKRDYTGTQIEVVNDYKITFEMLLNRHYSFDKVFTNNPDNLDEGLRRFEDKRGDLKNGLDNYYRTGSSKREVGLKKLADEEINPVIKLLIAYCENFLAGRKYIEERLDNVIKDLNDDNEEQEVKEQYSHIFKNEYNPYKLITLIEAEQQEEKDEYDDEFNETDFKDDDDDEKDDIEEAKENNRSMRDRQIGLAVLLNVAEERYFDYINILKGLMEE